ncbi:hypothetical protein QQZ08_008440 [Neonectria magnoliae]|uniref:Uncharacterized protein n=1 Tax=Neonectria magnoliae TaxID=2732573 RepID=A0ABR1HUU1_9HYPO
MDRNHWNARPSNPPPFVEAQPDARKRSTGLDDVVTNLSLCVDIALLFAIFALLVLGVGWGVCIVVRRRLKKREEEEKQAAQAGQDRNVSATVSRAMV